MAASNRSAVTIVAIIAIVILVGLAIYFVREETDDTLEIDISLLSEGMCTPGVGPPLEISPPLYPTTHRDSGTVRSPGWTA